MKFIPAFNALNAIVQTPAIRLWLLANEPKALRQAEEAIKTVPISDDPVTVAAGLLVERLENIIPNLAHGTAAVSATSCNHRFFVTVEFPVKTPATLVEAFCAFCKACLHESATVEGYFKGGIARHRVEFILDEDNY